MKIGEGRGAQLRVMRAPRRGRGATTRPRGRRLGRGGDDRAACCKVGTECHVGRRASFSAFVPSPSQSTYPPRRVIH